MPPLDATASVNPVNAFLADRTPEPSAYTPPPLTARQLAVEFLLRAGTVLLLLTFFRATMHEYLENPSRITLVIFVIAEAITVGIAVCTRIPRKRDWSALSVVLAVCGSFYYLAFRIKPGLHLIPESLGAALQISGIVFSLWAKISLRRSFGLLPGNRGVVVSGPYRFVRHPIYFGYLIKDLGFLLPNFGLSNLLIIMCLWCLQMGRIVREERLLSEDPVYVRYRQRVHYRLLIGVY